MTTRCSSTTAYYDAHAQEYFDASVNTDLHELHERFLRELLPGAHILDAGCGSGRDTRIFLEKGFRVTAIDASPELARLATEFTGHPCRVLTFQEMEFHEEFDGIWACASLLHVPLSEIDDVLRRFVAALKPHGIMYISLKEGKGERVSDDGRFFSYYTEDSFRAIIRNFPQLAQIAFWKTNDERASHHAAPWLSFLLKKEMNTTELKPTNPIKSQA